MKGKFECNNMMEILELLADNDQSSLSNLERMEKIIFVTAPKLRRDDIRRQCLPPGYFLMGDSERKGYFSIYSSKKPLVEMIDRACRLD
jgi:hypothetical protein